MKIIKVGIMIGLLALLVITGNRAGSQGITLPNWIAVPESNVAAEIGYQGRLTNPTTGAPLSGTYDLEFTFWSAQAPSGSQIGGTISKTSQNITNGLYSTSLNVSSSTFNGQGLWLQIRARETGGSWETLSPRIQVLPTAYALSLRPGAEIIGGVADPNAVITITNTSDGVGIFGFSDAGIGVYGGTGGSSNIDYGVYGNADNGVAYGVYGHKSGATGGLGVFGKNENGGSGVSGYNNGAGNGVWGNSVDYNGIGGGTGRSDSNYGLYTQDNLHSKNYTLLGAIMQVVQNGGTESLELGDVVVINGMDQSVFDGIPPIIRVNKTNEINCTGVLGVVYSTYSPEWLVDATDSTGATNGKKDIPLSNPGPIAPSEYLLLVVQGPTQVKASAVSGAIRAGDLLSSAEADGYAAKAVNVSINGVSTTIPGTVFGKAIEPLVEGQKLIYVYVTLQ